MTYEQLLPVYQQITGQQGSDENFNQWVQGIVNTSGSQQGVEGIPSNFFDTMQGRQYVDSTTTATPAQIVSGTGSGDAGTSGGGFGPLIAPDVVAPPFEQAPAPTVAGGNYNQVQNATQAGQFGTIGQNYQSQTGVTGQDQTGTTQTTGSQNTAQQNQQSTDTAQQQTGLSVNQQQNQGTTQSTQNQQQSGTSQEQQQQDSRTTGTTTQSTQNRDVTQAIDTLGFGKLLQDQAASTSASDAARQSWLQDTMQTGGSGFNSQVDQAVRRSLSGPQMTGTGQSAQARAAGYAGAEIGRNNLNQRLAASEQLAGPTGLTTLSSAANPFIGKDSTSTGTGTTFQDLITKGTTNTTGSQNTSGSTTGTQNTSGTSSGSQATSSNMLGSQNTTGSQNTQSLTDQLQNTASSTTGFQDLVTKGAESQAGVTLGQSSQAGAGQIPQGQPVQSGGCVLCTAAVEMKLPKANMLRVLRRVINHKLNVDRSAYRNAARGYFATFTPVARWLLSHDRIARTLWPIARAIVYEELRISGRRLPWKFSAWVTHTVGHNFCAAVGFLFPVRGHVTDPVINDIARRNNILFEVQS